MKSRWLILYIYMYVHYWHTSTRVSIQAAKLAKTCVGEEIIANRIYLTCNRYDNDLYKRKYIAYIKCKITLQFAVNIKYPSPNITDEYYRVWELHKLSGCFACRYRIIYVKTWRWKIRRPTNTIHVLSSLIMQQHLNT